MRAQDAVAAVAATAGVVTVRYMGSAESPSAGSSPTSPMGRPGPLAGRPPLQQYRRCAAPFSNDCRTQRCRAATGPAARGCGILLRAASSAQEWLVGVFATPTVWVSAKCVDSLEAGAQEDFNCNSVNVFLKGMARASFQLPDVRSLGVAGAVGRGSTRQQPNQHNNRKS